jgi:protoporphyrinogen IX oxidase
MLRLFEKGGRFGAIRFIGLTIANVATVSAIVWIVLAKPALDASGDGFAFFQPGALQEMTLHSLGDIAIPTP